MTRALLWMGCALLLTAPLTLAGCARGAGDGLCSCCCRDPGQCTERGVVEALGRDCDVACRSWCVTRACPFEEEVGACDPGSTPEVIDVELSCPAEGCLPDYTYDLTFRTENAASWESTLEVVIGDGSPGWLTPDSGDGGSFVEARYRAGDTRGDQIVITIEAVSGSGEVAYGSVVATIY